MPGPQQEAATTALNLEFLPARTAARTAAYFCQQEPQPEPQRDPQPEPQRDPQPEPQRDPQPEPQRDPQPEPQRERLSALPPDFTAIELQVCESALRTYELLENKIKSEQGELLEFIQITNAGQWFALTSCRNVERTWAASIYRRMVALPQPPVVVVRITKLMACGTLQKRIVFLLKNRPSARMTHDDFYIPEPEDYTECSSPTMLTSTRVPIVLYSRVMIDASYFKKTDTTETLKRLFVRVDDCVLGVPPEVEFLMVAYSKNCALISVFPGPQLLARLRKHNNWALNFKIPHESCKDFKNFFTVPPIVSDWTISEVEGFTGKFLENVEYQPPGDFFDPDIYDTLMQNRIAIASPPENPGTMPETTPSEQWGMFARCLLAAQRYEAYLTVRAKIDVQRIRNNWEEFAICELTCYYMQRKEHIREMLEIESTTIKPLCFWIDFTLHRMERTVLPDPWWGFRKIARFSRFLLKQERDIVKSQLLKKIHQLAKARLARKVVHQQHSMQLEQLQQQHSMQLEQLQQQHAMQLEQLQQQLATAQQDAMQLMQVQQQLATAQQEARIPCPEPQNCSICLERLANTVLLPCSHLCVCNQCYGVDLCPICRGPITERVNTIQVPWIVCIKCTRRLPNIVLQPCGHQVLCNTCVADGNPAKCPVCDASVDNVLQCFL